MCSHPYTHIELIYDIIFDVAVDCILCGLAILNNILRKCRNGKKYCIKRVCLVAKGMFHITAIWAGARTGHTTTSVAIRDADGKIEIGYCALALLHAVGRVYCSSSFGL